MAMKLRLFVCFCSRHSSLSYLQLVESYAYTKNHVERTPQRTILSFAGGANVHATAAARGPRARAPINANVLRRVAGVKRQTKMNRMGLPMRRPTPASRSLYNSYTVIGDRWVVSPARLFCIPASEVHARQYGFIIIILRVRHASLDKTRMYKKRSSKAIPYEHDTSHEARRARRYIPDRSPNDNL